MSLFLFIQPLMNILLQLLQSFFRIYFRTTAFYMYASFFETHLVIKSQKHEIQIKIKFICRTNEITRFTFIVLRFK